jgi:hypothetical protein
MAAAAAITAPSHTRQSEARAGRRIASSYSAVYRHRTECAMGVDLTGVRTASIVPPDPWLEPAMSLPVRACRLLVVWSYGVRSAEDRGQAEVMIAFHARTRYGLEVMTYL